MTDDNLWPGGLVCAQCRVITVRSGLSWIHPAALREKFATTGVCDAPVPGREPKPRESRFGRGAEQHREKHLIVSRLDGYPERIGRPVVLACDGSYKVQTAPRVRKIVSWGYLSSAGHWGLGSSAPSGLVVGDKPVLVAELRAIFWGLKALTGDTLVTLITDSQDAVELLAEWRRGGDRMPSGYSTAARSSGAAPLLIQLARLVRQRGALIDPVWVRSHQGVPLNEGADALSKHARAWGAGRLSKATVRADAEAAARAALARHAVLAAAG